MNNKVEVYALSCAGGNTLLFNDFVKCSNEYIEIVPIELAGHGRRMGEPFYNSIEEAVRDVYEIVCKRTNNDTRYVFLGYSMGGIISYEVCCLLEENGKKMPEHIFISSMRTPESIGEFGKVIEKSDEEITQHVVKLGGIPKEIVESSVYNTLFFPVIKNDFCLLSKYHVSKIKSFDVDLTILYGEEDYKVKDSVKDWAKYTNRQFDYISYRGGHFFINEHSEKMFLDISNKIIK